MVFTCCVPECNTGYYSSQAVEKVPVFRFPKNDKLRQKWKKAIPCKNSLLGDGHRVSAKHFEFGKASSNFGKELQATLAIYV